MEEAAECPPRVSSAAAVMKQTGGGSCWTSAERSSVITITAKHVSLSASVCGVQGRAAL